MVIDEEQLGGLAEAAGTDGVRAILDAFWASTQEISEGIVAAVSSDDTDSISKLGHALKGSAANVGASQLATRAREIEQAARGGDVDGVRAKLARFVTDISETRTAMDTLLRRYG